MSDIISVLFGNFIVATIFICSLIVVIFLFIRFKRIYVLLELLIWILIFSIYISVVIPAIVEPLCGNPDTIQLYQLGAVVSYASDPSLSAYLYLETLKPLAGLDAYFEVLLNLIGSVVLGVLIVKAGSKLRRADKDYKNLEDS